MSEALKPFLAALAAGARPDPDSVAQAFSILMAGEASEAQIGAALMGLMPFSRDAGVLAAGARAMRAQMTAASAPADAIDVCGTGGDGAQTLNVSTAVAFVLAGCGVPVAKHGNRAMSSKSGAADVLEALGVDLAAPLDRVERALEQAKVAFLFAQNHHPAMRHVGAARRALGFRTVFNVLGPLCNPCGVRRQLLGVFDPSWVEPLAQTLADLGAERAWVLHGSGLDEVSLEGPTEIVALEHGALRRLTLTAADFGLSSVAVSAIAGGAPQQNADALRRLLEEGPASHEAYAAYVMANAAAALVVAERTNDVREGVAMAYQSLQSGAAGEALAMLRTITRSDAP